MADTFAFEIVTPAQLMLSEAAELVILPGAEGDFGVLPGHSPMLSALRPGTIEIRDKALKVLDRIFVEGGFIDVTPQRCTVLAEEAVKVSAISRADAETRLKHAYDAVAVSTTLKVKINAERDVRIAEAMVAAVDANERQGRGAH